MTNIWKIAAIALLAGTAMACGTERGSYEYEESAAEAVPEFAASEDSAFADMRGAGPDVSVTAAPGVAFDYRYAYRLDGPKIETLVERHAAACEELGVDQCRIVGLRYNLRDENRISASLAVKLAPERARDFGKQATGAVVEEGGMLVAQEITGTDAGARIDAANRAQSRIRAEIAELQEQLEGMSANNRARGDIVARIDQLQRQLRASEGSEQQAEIALAETPMTFHYGAGDVIPGWGDKSPIAGAFKTAGYLFQEVIAFVIVMAGAVIPLALIFWLLAIAYRVAAPAIAVRRKAAPEAKE
ncbi:DUF4349 domain-containing protein [Sphingomicrobium sediminis]|uniref:DUF4349 domain-containing protein n=1 Tax=Sphingomicrobium sediminis TaxID=2950949 RepID=A0A9X2EEA0_9SPHN|nr:DUF4349 domain-containing protein [Sphingomicrobium sediminis]MCM8556438.1 DUF4349 domain-containing protein [Sphingomicrobium sediminis]